VVSADLVEQFQAVQSTHLVVGDDTVEGLCREPSQSRLGIRLGGDRDGGCLPSEEIVRQLEEVGVVIEMENADRVTLHKGTTRNRSIMLAVIMVITRTQNDVWSTTLVSSRH
jgi:hypothetical protein